MPAGCKDTITKELGVQPIQINSKLVSAQLRGRLYWTNIPNIKQPKDKGITFQSILEPGGYTDRLKSRCITARNGYEKTTNWERLYRRYHEVGFNMLNPLLCFIFISLGILSVHLMPLDTWRTHLVEIRSSPLYCRQILK